MWPEPLEYDHAQCKEEQGHKPEIISILIMHPKWHLVKETLPVTVYYIK
jgi:hypothetical protein